MQHWILGFVLFTTNIWGRFVLFLGLSGGNGQYPCETCPGRVCRSSPMSGVLPRDWPWWDLSSPAALLAGRALNLSGDRGKHCLNPQLSVNYLAGSCQNDAFVTVRASMSPGGFQSWGPAALQCLVAGALNPMRDQDPAPNPHKISKWLFTTAGRELV